MHDLHMTRHAEMRMQQRDFRKADLDLVYRLGTAVADNRYFLRDKDAAREIDRLRHLIRQIDSRDKNAARETGRLRQMIHQIDCLRGALIVVIDDSVITTYRSDGNPSRSISRNRRRPTKHRRGRSSWRRA